MLWWDGRQACADVATRPWRALRSAEEARSAFVRSRALKEAVYVLEQCWTPAECDSLAAAATSAAVALGGWTSARHAAFPTRDLPADALPPRMAADLRLRVGDRVLRPAASRAGFDRTDDLVVRDLFVVCYEATDGGQPALELHRDGSLISFNVLLSPADAFTGGGTAFPHLRGGAADVADGEGVVRLAQGDACVHSGNVLHGGAAVLSGRRVLLVGFVDSARPPQRQAAPAEA